MRKLNRIAWEMLTEAERTALTLQHGHEKSSWKAGEIMDRSHYKYLEILYRGQQFLRLFTEHAEIFDCLIPDYVSGSKLVVKYFKLCLEKRLKPMDAIIELSKTHGRILKSNLNEKIIKTLEDWEASKEAYDNACFELVKEFDRWNNFRILPKAIQEPSAFKRRIKNTYKKHLRMVTSINTLSLDKIVKHYETNKSGFGTACLPFMYDGSPLVIRVIVNQQSSKIFNSLSFYLFAKKDDATEYIEAISEYMGKGKKSCTDGLDFWPKYRDTIKKAQNYAEIQKITPSRKYLQLALSKLEFV